MYLSKYTFTNIIAVACKYKSKHTHEDASKETLPRLLILEQE